MSIDPRWLARVLVIISALRGNTDVVPRRVPFLPFLLSVGSDEAWLNGLHVGVIVGTILVLTPAWRFGSILVGSTWTVAVLGNMGALSNGRLFQGLLLIFCGLATTEFGVSLLRAQIVVLYAGAALSKAVDRDWWNGRFIASLWEFHRGSLDSVALSWIARPVGIVTIVAEAAIAVALVSVHRRNAGVALSILIHSLTVVALNEDFATFSYNVVLATGVLFVSIPTVRAVRCRFPRFVRMSPFAALRLCRLDAGPLKVDLERCSLSGLPAFGFLCVLTMPGQLALLGVAAASTRLGASLVRDTIFGTIVVLLVKLVVTIRGHGKASSFRMPPGQIGTPT